MWGEMIMIISSSLHVERQQTKKWSKLGGKGVCVRETEVQKRAGFRVTWKHVQCMVVTMDVCIACIS